MFGKKTKRQTKTQRINRRIGVFTVLILGAILGTLTVKSFADIIDGDDARVEVDSELTYYLNVKEDGVDATGVESSDTQMADVRSGRITVTDMVPEGLVFQGFVTTSDGTFGAVSRSDSSIQCSGKVIDDTNEEAIDTGTWNSDYTKYYYHGLHYDANTRTVSFMAEKIKAGCQLTVGIITQTPTTVDDPDTTLIETRRDFYNKAFAAEKDVSAISNSVHAYIGDSNTVVYKVRYRYSGNIPRGAPIVPSDESYSQDAVVPVDNRPSLEGYTFSGWSTGDAIITDDVFLMPDQDVELVGIWTKNTAATKYTVTYVVNGDKPADFMLPATKEYEADVTVDLDSTEANAVIDGYRFSGWSTSDAELSETGFTMPAQNVTIVGSFERISYTVCYEFEGVIMPDGANLLLPPCETHYPGDTVTTADNPQAEGYGFLGWYKNAAFKMPEENVIIRGEWGRAMGKFAPTIAKTIVNSKDEYMYGETVKFKITVTNTAAYEITDVFLREELDGAVFTTPVDDSYIIKTNTIAVIPSIPAGASVDVYAEYKVTENVAQTLTNTVELTGALAEDNVLNTDQEYKATISFDTTPEPVPFTGVIFNALPYVGLVILGAGIIFELIVSLRDKKIMRQVVARVRRLDTRVLFRASLPCFAIVGILIGGIIAKNVSAENYIEVIRSIELTSQHTSYTNNAPGAWNIKKSAEWVEAGEARIIFDVDTVSKMANNAHVDILMVLDNSGSMEGAKLAQVKHDATDLIDKTLVDTDNRIALVNFNSDARTLSDFTNNRDTLLTQINNLDSMGNTNYYDAFLKAESILEGYTKQSNRELIMIFLTDGFPNNQTPNENTAYIALKEMYPYMIINAIQYEMGDAILDPIRQISDKQYIADMSSLNNVLLEAVITPYNYGDFTLTDYINGEYWDIKSIDKIEASIGEVALTQDGSMPVVTWTMKDILRSGKTARLTIDVSLKENVAIDDELFLPTNDHETVRTILPDVPDENIISESTPILKSSYKVRYEPNLPNSCDAYDGILPDEQTYLPLTIVEKSSNVLSCDGYNFNGWVIAEGDPNTINDDYFKIKDDDVLLRATWTKVFIGKSMDGTVKEEVVANLDAGFNINAAWKGLAGIENASNYSNDRTVVAIKKANVMTPDQRASASAISTTESPAPVYSWFDNTDGTIYIYSEADIIKAGENTLVSLFQYFEALTNFDGAADWDTSDATSMYHTFAFATNLPNIDAAANWNTSNVTNMFEMFGGDKALTNVDGAANWDTSKVTTMVELFYNDTNLTNIDGLANWDTSSVTSFHYAFGYTSNLVNIDGLANWNTSSVTDMSRMFIGDGNIASLDALADWDVSNLQTTASMFSMVSKITNLDGLANWNTVSLTRVDNMFQNCFALIDIDGLANWNTSNVTSMNSVFYSARAITDIDALEDWDTSSVTDMTAMFRDAQSLTNIDGAINWNVSKVRYMTSMFQEAKSLTNIDGAINWNVSKVERTSSMFANTRDLTNIDGAANWNTVSFNMISSMFANSAGLTNVDGAANWSISNASSLNSMFTGAKSLVDISGLADWDTSKITDMQYTFYNTGLTNINDLAGWDTSKVTNMSMMLKNMTNLTDISGAANWDVSKVTNMKEMFYGDSGILTLDPIFDWRVTNLGTKTNMFYGIPSTVTRPSWY